MRRLCAYSSPRVLFLMMATVRSLEMHYAVFHHHLRRRELSTTQHTFLIIKVQPQAPQGMTMIPDPNQQDLSGNYHPQESDLTGKRSPNLDSLRDAPPGSKPPYLYSTLIRYAWYSSSLPQNFNILLYFYLATPSKALQIRNYYLRIFIVQLNPKYV